MLDRPDAFCETFSPSNAVEMGLYTRVPLLQHQSFPLFSADPEPLPAVAPLTYRFGFCPLHNPDFSWGLTIKTSSAGSDEEDLLAAIMPETMGLLSKMVKHF